jgi:hypothetical protein
VGTASLAELQGPIDTLFAKLQGSEIVPFAKLNGWENCELNLFLQRIDKIRED